MSSPIVCQRFKKAREDAELSLSEAAGYIGCTKSHLWEIERGTATNPGLNILRGAAKTYDVSVAALIGEAPFVSVEHSRRWLLKQRKKAECHD